MIYNRLLHHYTHFCSMRLSIRAKEMVRMSHRPIPVRELQFTYAAPADLSAYVSLFGTSPRFGGKESYLRMSREVLLFPILYSDPRLLKAFEPIAEELKNNTRSARSPICFIIRNQAHFIMLLKNGQGSRQGNTVRKR
ncbi:hypothetical protein EHV15_21480 [Paenibacillus oralis]|uniref:HTH-type transcriptional regulator AraC-type N-terminal domain-containing protein n=1 Tax=Paenibacillus oralis TaxID=2490856 RepID=A0A3P3U6E9_9BACL|nr:hypothetical protein EHV15_21480 [Paenibacillus oralis]